jgi:MFS family permease
MTISAKQSQQGKIAGVNTMCQGIGMTFGPIGGAALYHLQPDMPYYFAVASITLLVLAILNVKQ